MSSTSKIICLMDLLKVPLFPIMLMRWLPLKITENEWLCSSGMTNGGKALYLLTIATPNNVTIAFGPVEATNLSMVKEISSLIATKLGIVVTMVAETRRQAYSNPDWWPPVSISTQFGHMNFSTAEVTSLRAQVCSFQCTKVLHYLGGCQQRGRTGQWWKDKNDV